MDWKIVRPGVGYLRLSSFPDSVHSVLGWAMASVGHEPALILDLRGNPGGLVDSVDEVAGIFLPPGTLISTGTRRYNLFGSQRFTATDNAGFSYPGRLVVLIDKNSRSGAESLARALQYYHRATLVGTRSAGKVLGVDAEMTLADGGLLRVATLDMHAPDGQRLEGAGVHPNVLVSEPAHQLSTAIVIANPGPAASPPSPTSPCPLSVSDFSVASLGKPQGFVEYRVGVRNSAPVPIATKLDVYNDALVQVGTVIVSEVDSAADAILFRWRDRSLVRVALSQVEANGGKILCQPTSSVALAPRLSLIADAHRKRSYTGPRGEPMPKDIRDAADQFWPEFDDSSVVDTSPTIGSTLRDARLSFVSPLDYPYEAHTTGEQGSVLVAVIVGSGGNLVGTSVLKTSGFPILDAAALASARGSRYTEPEINGKPANRAYLVDFYFELE